jgi:hypothetical protein
MSNDLCCWNNGLLGIINHHKVEGARYKETHHPPDIWETTRRESDRTQRGGISGRSQNNSNYSTSSRSSYTSVTGGTARTARTGELIVSQRGPARSSRMTSVHKDIHHKQLLSARHGLTVKPKTPNQVQDFRKSQNSWKNNSRYGGFLSAGVVFQ